MAMRFSLSLLLFFIFTLFLHASIAYNDPIIQTMEEFSGYPPIQEPLFSNPEAARQNQIRIVEVSNLSLDVSPRFIRTFFSTCGNIESVEMQSNFEQSQTAFVTFEHSLGADCAVLSSGTKLLGLTVVITLAPSHQHLGTQEKTTAGAEFSFVKTKDVFSSILANGYLLGKGAVNKAKAFDEMHQLTSTTTAKVASFDKKIGISEKVIIGTSLVNDKVREVDQKLLISEKVKLAYDVGTSAVNDKFHQVDQSLRVSGKVKSAIAVAGETVTTAKSAVLKNEYVSTGVSWVTGAFNSIAKAAAEVSQHAKEKVAMAEEEQIKKPA